MRDKMRDKMKKARRNMVYPSPLLTGERLGGPPGVAGEQVYDFDVRSELAIQ
jgi:hypothetical protein